MKSHINGSDTASAFTAEPVDILKDIGSAVVAAFPEKAKRARRGSLTEEQRAARVREQNARHQAASRARKKLPQLLTMIGLEPDNPDRPLLKILTALKEQNNQGSKEPKNADMHEGVDSEFLTNWVSKTTRLRLVILGHDERWIDLWQAEFSDWGIGKMVQRADRKRAGPLGPRDRDGIFHAHTLERAFGSFLEKHAGIQFIPPANLAVKLRPVEPKERPSYEAGAKLVAEAPALQLAGPAAALVGDPPEWDWLRADSKEGETYRARWMCAPVWNSAKQESGFWRRTAHWRAMKAARDADVAAKKGETASSSAAAVARPALACAPSEPEDAEKWEETCRQLRAELGNDVFNLTCH